MEGKTLLRVAIVVVCLAVTVLGYENSNGDNSDVIPLASKAACSSDACTAVLSQTARSSFGHDYSFQVRQGASPTAPTHTLVVECKRALIFVGDWACNVKTGN